ncbi:hypothetical protein T484DRAFT_3578624 [Baffinella frigidus]|nr:hypothetical protein T484DRAFT_3578624 [Cryptophyta sp. CCMP2293]
MLRGTVGTLQSAGPSRASRRRSSVRGTDAIKLMCGIGVGAWHQVLQQVAEEEARGMEREAQLEAESLVRDRMVGLIEAGVDVQGVETPRPSGTDEQQEGSPPGMSLPGSFRASRSGHTRGSTARDHPSHRHASALGQGNGQGRGEEEFRHGTRTLRNGHHVLLEWSPEHHGSLEANKLPELEHEPASRGRSRSQHWSVDRPNSLHRETPSQRQRDPPHGSTPERNRRSAAGATPLYDTSPSKPGTLPSTADRGDGAARESRGATARASGATPRALSLATAGGGEALSARPALLRDCELHIEAELASLERELREEGERQEADAAKLSPMDGVMRDIQVRHARLASYQLPMSCIIASFRLVGPLLLQIQEEYSKRIVEMQASLQVAASAVLQPDGGKALEIREVKVHAARIEKELDSQVKELQAKIKSFEHKLESLIEDKSSQVRHHLHTNHLLCFEHDRDVGGAGSALATIGH